MYNQVNSLHKWKLLLILFYFTFNLFFCFLFLFGSWWTPTKHLYSCMIFAGQLYCRDIYTCCALIPQEDAEYCSLCLALSHMETRMLCLASWLEQAGPLSDHSCRCTVNVFPCSRGSQQGLIATKPSVIQECNYLLTQIIYLAGSPYPSHRAASTCQ